MKMPHSFFASHLDRRSFLIASATLAGWAISGCSAAPRSAKPCPPLPAYPFQLGVASGEPSADGMVLWTRLAPLPLAGGGMPPEAVEVNWEIADDERFTSVVQQGIAVAAPELAHSVHVELAGLTADRWYFYRFRVGDACSPIGRTRTLPAADALVQRLRLSVASCQHWESGLFTAYEHMLKEDLDLVLFLGDYIYELEGRDGGVRKHVGPRLTTLDHYRTRHAQYRSDPALQAMHAGAPWLVAYDDHEIENNWAGDISQNSEVSRDDFLRLRAAGFQAYYEHMPLRLVSKPQGPNMHMYRSCDFGRLARLVMLDTRHYRTDQPCGDGEKTPTDAVMDPAGTMLGQQQRDWLFGQLAASPAQWNAIAQQVMMARVNRVDHLDGDGIRLEMDQWPGYEFERRRILKFLHDKKIANPVVLTGDIHSNWANDLIADFDGLDGRIVAAEFVGTSISAGGDGFDIFPKIEKLMAANPFVKHRNNRRGYLLCTVDKQQWRTDYRTVDYVRKPGSPIRTAATYVVEAGTAGLRRS